MDFEKSSQQSSQKIQQERNNSYLYGKIGQIYTYNEVIEILNRYQKREATKFKLQEDTDKGDLKITCEGQRIQSPQQDQGTQSYVSKSEKNMEKKMSVLTLNQQKGKSKCQFNLTFRSQISEQKRSDIELYSGCEFSLKQQPNQSIAFQDQDFKLLSINIKHSDNCIGKNIDFIVQRNSNFLGKDDIYNQIQLNYHIGKTSNDYLVELKKHFGYDFLHLGLKEKSSKFKLCRRDLKKDFDNLVAKIKLEMNQIVQAEQTIENERLFKRSKAPYAIPNQDHYDSNQQAENENLQNEQDIYKPSKEKLKMTRTSLYQTRKKKVKKIQVTDSAEQKQI